MVAVPKALAPLGIAAGHGLRVSGPEKFPLFPAVALGAGLVVGLPAAGGSAVGVPAGGGSAGGGSAGGGSAGGAPAGVPRGRLAGYAVIRLSDGRVTPLPLVHPGWDPGLAPRPVAATANRVIWLEADRRPGGYLWVLYAARGPGSRPELLDGSREPVPADGVPNFIGVKGDSACWSRSDDGRSWTIVRRPVTGAGPTITARMHGTVSSCLPAGNDTIVVAQGSAAQGNATEGSPSARNVRAGYPAPGNVLDVTSGGRVSILLSGAYDVSLLGQRVAYYSVGAGARAGPGAGAASRTVSVGRLAGHKLTGIRTLEVNALGGRSPALLMWLDSTHLLLRAAADLAQTPLLLVDVRTGQTAPVLPRRSLLYWEGVANGHLIYARSLPSPGPDQSLEIDEFNVRR